MRRGSPLHQDFRTGVDFVDSLTRVSFRTDKRLDRLVLLACCLTLLPVGKMDGQSTEPQQSPTTPSGGLSNVGSGGLGISTAGNPSAGTQENPNQNQREIDISGPRPKEQTPEKLTPQAVTLPPT